MVMAELSDEYLKLLEKQQYGLLDKSSAVKICTWTKKSLRDDGFCYKQKFYGINCHRCCQMSTTLGVCSNSCVFCWRDLSQTVGVDKVNETGSVKEIIDKAILAQRKLLSGFKGNDKCNLKKWSEAQDPVHFAISLTGEPTADKKLGELISEINSRGFSSFVVSNGQYPDRLNINPTQFYLSVDAPNKNLFEEIDNPHFSDGWERLQKSLDCMKGMKCRTALRITLIKEMNMVEPENYAQLIEKSQPNFVEIKAYMWVGSSRERLEEKNMPRHEEVKEFALKIAEKAGMKLIDEQKESRVVLLMKKDFKGRIMHFQSF